ncbi:MAG TPA: alpha/beta hydrolase [Solirubrobacteraceae bacterium]|nr:alpha/beta hydrolase [Solirubrobacteraceae bacterium]
MTGTRFEVELDGTRVVGDRWQGPGPTVVLLHAGVTDRRGWREVAELLAPAADVITYDRRGFGESPVAANPFSHLDDLLVILDRLACQSAWLVGSSMGGGLAVDAALVAPARIAGLVLIAPGVSGGPDLEDLDAATARLDELLDRAAELADHDEVNRLETWLWLDGPAGPEGRVGGEARELALAMNAVILGNDQGGAAGRSEPDAWSRLGEIPVPATVIWGELDVASIAEESRLIAQVLPNAVSRVLPGVAHLPYVERPGIVADALLEALSLPAR